MVLGRVTATGAAMSDERPAGRPDSVEGLTRTAAPSLAAPDRGALWVRLALTGPQLAALCGLTTRQVKHWVAQGYLTPARRTPTRFNGEAIELGLLIQQGLAHGLPLRRAVALARDYLAGELARQPGITTLDPDLRRELAAHVQAAHAALAAVLAAVEPRVPDDAESGRGSTARHAPRRASE